MKPGAIIVGVIDAYRLIIDALTASRRVLVTTHVRPDGDALGTVAATVLGMRKVGIDAEVLLLSHLPRKYAFVFEDNEIVYHDAEQGWPARWIWPISIRCWWWIPGHGRSCRACGRRIEQWPGRKLVVDHHLTQEDWADVKLVVTEAAAAGEIAAELLDVWQIDFDRAHRGRAVPGDRQRYGVVSIFQHAAVHASAGGPADRAWRRYRSDVSASVPERAGRARGASDPCPAVAGTALDGRLAVMRVAKEEFERTGANVGDTENLINIPLQIRTVEVSLLFVEPRDAGPVRVSLRSKGQVDVAKFAEQFGGGGHARAAGLKVNGSLREVHDRVVSAMTKSLSQNTRT